MHKIRRLYEGDALGMLDAELLDDVGHAIYIRCQDILEISAAQRGRVKCRNCGSVIRRRQGKRIMHSHGGIVLVGGEAELLRCHRCAWQVTWRDYLRSVQGQRLDELGVERILGDFVREWPAARSPGAKLLLIDRLIHEFHVTADGPGCPLGVNVIKGNASEVYELLKSLSYGPASTPGVQQADQRWRANVKHLEYSKTELQVIARELGVKGCGRLHKEDLIATIERIAPERLSRVF
jgi:hypothetical protein